MIKIRMVKTLAPDEIPNGSVGIATPDVMEPGLHRAWFGEHVIFVYPHEIERMAYKGESDDEM